MKASLEEVECTKINFTSLKSEYDELTNRMLKKEETIKNTNNRHSQLIKKIDLLSQEKKILEEKNLELENDKKKLIEKWQK